MSRMRFPGPRKPRSIHQVIKVGPDREPEHLGDVPAAPAEPTTVAWSLTTWPHADPEREQEDPADG